MTDKKRKTVRIFQTTLCLVAALLLLFMTGCKDGYTLFAPSELTLDVADRFALEQYDADRLQDVRATLRADTMYVTERNIARPTTQLLTDDYSLVYDETAASTSGTKAVFGRVTGNNTATINFVRYPYPGGAGGDDGHASVFENAYADQAYDMFNIGAGASEKEKAAARTKYYYYYKYMLLSQGYNLALEEQTRSANGTLTQEWLKKHPAADLQYGEVKGTNNAVEKVITLDTLYRSSHATGLYLPAGEAVTVKVEGLGKGESISIFIGMNNSLAWRGNAMDSASLAALRSMGVTNPSSGSGAFFGNADTLVAGGHFFDFYNAGSVHQFIQSQWNRQNNRAPWITAEFVFSENRTYTIGTAFGGIMHINPRNCYSPVTTTIRGAVETPHYILGVTTPEYYEKYLISEETAPGVYSVIDTENGQLIGKASYMRNNTPADEVEKLAYLWHSFFSVNESFTGGTYNRPNKVQFDQHVPAGAAVALGGYVYACPTGWYNAATNYRHMLNYGSWGILHEIGHNHGGAYGSIWGMGGSQEGEVRNNALTCLAYLKFCDLGTWRNEDGVISAEHGDVGHPYSAMVRLKNIMNKTHADFNNLDYFDALNIYVNIMHSFGVDKFYEFMRTYKDNPSFNPVVNNQAVGNKRSDFIYRLSTVYKMDFRPYVDGIFKGNTTAAMYSAEQIAEMDALPKYYPVSNVYAGGIDGVKTGGDYRIGYGIDKVFDLKSTTITTAESFEILGFEQPEHGTLTDEGDGKYRYSFNKKYTGGYDSFTFDVRLSDGVCHRLTVYLRFVFSGATVESYGGVASADLNAEEALLAEKTPLTVVTEQAAGVANYTSSAENKYEVKVSKFWYKAPSSGQYGFSMVADDKGKLYFGENFETMEQKIEIDSYIGKYDDKNSFTATLQEGRYYAFKLVNLNTGGKGGAGVGVKFGDATGYASIAASQIRVATVENPSVVEDPVYEPKLLVSKKDNVIAGTMTTDKGEWEVLEAPEDIQGGRYVEEIMTDEETGEQTVFKTDKRTWLIDGQTGTIFHTVWSKNPTPATDDNPDVFVIDTQRRQSFNYFKITAPNRSDYCIKRYELLISDDNVTYTKIAEGTADSPLAYRRGVAELTFPQTFARYLKLVVKETSAPNGNYTVISEIDAGIKSHTDMVYPSNSAKYYYSKGWRATAAGNGDRQRSGLMWAEKKNAKLVFKIKSSAIALYSDKGVGYGSAKIKLDGKPMDTVSLQSDKQECRQLIFYAENLKENKEHTVEIITTSNSPFNLDFIGATYNSSLVNAPNIYLERGLIISLVVFILLFAMAVAVICVIYFVPSVRTFLFKNDGAAKKEKTAKAKTAKAEKREKPTAAGVTGISTTSAAKLTATDTSHTTRVTPQKPTVRPAPSSPASRPVTSSGSTGARTANAKPSAASGVKTTSAAGKTGTVSKSSSTAKSTVKPASTNKTDPKRK